MEAPSQPYEIWRPIWEIKWSGLTEWRINTNAAHREMKLDLVDLFANLHLRRMKMENIFLK